MSSQQLSIFSLLALPVPDVIQDRIRNSDVIVGDETLEVLETLTHGKPVLGAIEGLSHYVPLDHLIFPPVTAGYTQINEKIKELNGFTLARSSIESTVRQLLRLGFLKCNKPPAFNSGAEYQTLTPEGKRTMLRGVNVTHFRVYRSQVLLIAPVYGRPHVI